jgi:hypothetical protein
MPKFRVGTGVVFIALLLLALPVGALAKKDGNNGQDKSQFTNHDLKGTYSFRLVPAKSFSADAPGDPGNIASAPRQDILRVGVFTADGAGAITAGHTLATTDTNAGATFLIDFSWTGTYAINPDGTGSLSINTPTFPFNSCTDTTVPAAGVCLASFETAETYAIVLNRHGDDKTVELIQTDNVGGGAKIFMTGQAKKQSGD